MRTKIFYGDHKLTSPYGPRGNAFHNGVDFSMNIGTDLIVPDTFNGARVRLNTKDKFGGKYIQLVRADGKGCYWLHNSKNLIAVGKTVKTGDVIAISGNSGNSTGAHVHFGVQKKATVWGSHEDPMPYITLDGNEMFKVGDNVKFIGVQNIRSGSGVEYSVTRKSVVGETAVIKDGPRTSDGYTWYDMKFDTGGTGWVANVKKFEQYVPEPPMPVDPCQAVKDENKELKSQIADLEVKITVLEQENINNLKEIERLKPYQDFHERLSTCLSVVDVE